MIAIVVAVAGYRYMAVRTTLVAGGVRHFRMRHSTIAGWRMQGESTALGYYLRIF